MIADNQSPGDCLLFAGFQKIASDEKSVKGSFRGYTRGWVHNQRSGAAGSIVFGQEAECQIHPY